MDQPPVIAIWLQTTSPDDGRETNDPEQAARKTGQLARRVISLFKNSGGDQNNHCQTNYGDKHLSRHSTLLSPLTRGVRPTNPKNSLQQKARNPNSYRGP